jgi:hypothetical protein
MVIARIYNGPATIKGCYNDDNGPVSVNITDTEARILQIVETLRGLYVPVVVWRHGTTTAVISAE